MKAKRIAIACTVCACLVALAACQQAPVTGRRQLILVTAAQEAEMGEQGYAEVLRTSKLSDDAEMTGTLRRVGARIAAAANRPDFQWEFNLIESDQVNAFALPGGKVAFYTGILPICRNEAGVACVMGHEVAHVLARHGAERVSQGVLVEAVGAGLAVALRSKDPAVRNGVLAAYGLGASVGVLLPYSRTHESEADRIGIELAARAGYDPAEAPALWDRMAELGGSGTPEFFSFLSTHPNSARRAAELRRVLPEMENIYRSAPHQYGAGIVLKTK